MPSFTSKPPWANPLTRACSKSSKRWFSTKKTKTNKRDDVNRVRTVSPNFAWKWIEDSWHGLKGFRLNYLGLCLLFMVILVIIAVIPLVGKPIVGFLSPLIAAG